MAARYWRIYITECGIYDRTTIREVEMRATVGGADQTGSGTAGASSEDGSLVAGNAFDNGSSYWGSDPAETLPQWLSYDFGSDVDVAEVLIQATPSFAYAPTEFYIQSSSDNINWTDKLFVTGEAAWSYQESRTYEIPVPTAQTAHSTESANAITPARAFGVGGAGDSENSGVVAPIRVVAVFTAAEADTAIVVDDGVLSVDAGSAADIESAGSVQAVKIVGVGVASDVDAAPGITAVYVIPVGVAGESGAAAPVANPTFARVLTAQEIGSAGEVDAPNLFYLSLPCVLNTTGAAVYLFNDWSAAVPDSAIITWLLDIEGSPDLRLAIKSWQATLRADYSSFVQVVVPAVANYVDEITARLGNDMVITRRATTHDGAVFEQELARAPATTPRFQRGPGRHTLTLSGNATSFYTPETPDAETTRTLQKIRSISSGDEFRARCDVDWFLRPGQQAVADGDTITVSYINYYANERGAYMDVGGVAA